MRHVFWIRALQACIPRQIKLFQVCHSQNGYRIYDVIAIEPQLIERGKSLQYQQVTDVVTAEFHRLDLCKLFESGQ